MRLPLILLTLLVLIAPVRADTKPRVVVIFDGSGSMWGALGDSPKVVTAQQALERKLDAIDGRIEFGLVSFGNHRKTCEDIETVLPVGPLDTGTATLLIDRLSPRGLSPLAGALDEAVAALGDGPGHILVIGDGGDNCRRDACTVADAFASGEPSRTVDVISLTNSDKERPKLACVASKGHGQLIEVASPEAFDAALDTVFSKLPGLSAAPAAEPKVAIAEPASLSAVVQLAAASQPILDGVSWRVRSGGADGAVVYDGKAAPAKLVLVPGPYVVEASIGQIHGSAAVSVLQAGPTEALINLDAGHLSLKTVRAGAANASLSVNPAGSAFYSIYPASAAAGDPSVAIAHEDNPVFLLPAGDYRVVLEDGFSRIERTVKLAAGDEKVEAINLDVGTLILEARSAGGAAPLANVVFSIREDDPASPGGERELLRSGRSEPRIVLPAGVFHVVARAGFAEVRADAAVKPGEESRLTINIPAATLRVSARLTGTAERLTGQLEYKIVRDTDSVEVYRGAAKSTGLVLAPGTYRVTALYGEINASAENAVILAAGDSKDLVLDIPAGMVKLSLLDAASGSSATLWDIRNSDGISLWTTSETEPSLPLLAGTYDAIATLREKEIKTRFTLNAGETKTVTVSPQ